MREIHNPGVANMAEHHQCSARLRRPLLLSFMAILLLAILNSMARAEDWYQPEQELARKIVAVTGPGAVGMTVANRSSLSSRDTDVVSDGLRSAFQAAGLRLVKPEQAAASITITLSENSVSWVWVAEIHQSADQSAVVMVSITRETGKSIIHDSVPLTLRKTPLWTQTERILDVAVLEESAVPTRIAVLDARQLSFYRWVNGKWLAEQSLLLSHPRPWPRDLRGRLAQAADRSLDVYLPGVICRTVNGSTTALSCKESDDPWPLAGRVFGSGSGSALSGGAPVSAFFASTRNFFTGALAPGLGNFTNVGKFYSAAFVSREKYVLWLFAGADRQVHLVDGMSDITARFNWGSDIATVRTSCGSGWQVLATGPGNPTADSIRAYEFPGRDPVAVSLPVDLDGEVTALWAEAKGDTAVVITKDRGTGKYEASRLAMACSQ